MPANVSVKPGVTSTTRIGKPLTEPTQTYFVAVEGIRSVSVQSGTVLSRLYMDRKGNTKGTKMGGRELMNTEN